MRKLVLCGTLMLLAGCGTSADRAAYQCRAVAGTAAYSNCFNNAFERDRRALGALAGFSAPPIAPVPTPSFTAVQVPPIPEPQPTAGALDAYAPHYLPAPSPATQYVPVAAGDPLNAGLDASGSPTR